MALPELAPITDADLAEYCEFLQRNLNPDISAESFQAAFRQRWGMEKPNHGFLIRDGGELVGGIGAIYALRRINGKPERFCNITSWCVLEKYRAQSMRLAMAVVSQEGFHFTDLTPTEVVEKSLQFLKFRPLDGSRTLLTNIPAPAARGQVITDPQRIVEALPPELGAVYADHKGFPWLQQAALGKPGSYCHVIFKRKTVKGLPSAEIVALSDGELFLRYRWAFGCHLLRNHGMVTTRVESRLLPKCPTLAKELHGYRNKMFRSATLEAKDIDNLYSELVVLDL